jgi:hypothetical protein
MRVKAAGGAAAAGFTTIPSIGEASGGLARPGQVFVCDDEWGQDATGHRPNSRALSPDLRQSFMIKVQVALDAATEAPLLPTAPLVIYNENRAVCWIVRDSGRWAESAAALGAEVRKVPGAVKAYFAAELTSGGDLKVMLPATVFQRW